MSKSASPPHPQWALKHKQPGTELRLINGRYYLYEYKTIYDPLKKKPRKVSGKLLGSIQETKGFVPSPARLAAKLTAEQSVSLVVVKEYGVAQLIMTRLEHTVLTWRNILEQCGKNSLLLLIAGWCTDVR